MVEEVRGNFLLKHGQKKWKKNPPVMCFMKRSGKESYASFCQSWHTWS
jgi:hypothetical protein